MILNHSQPMSFGDDDFMIIDTSGVGQDMREETDHFHDYIPQVKPLLPEGSHSSGSSSSSSYYTANTSFGTPSSSPSPSSSSLYFTPNTSFREEKPSAYLLKDGITENLLSVDTPETIARKQEIKLEQTADRELEAILKERDLAYDPEQRAFHMDVDREPESWGEDKDIWVTFDRDSASMDHSCRDTDSAEATYTVTPVAGPSEKVRSLARSETEIIEPAMIFGTASTPLDIGNWTHPQPLRRQHMERWNI
ncbi:hypothetical protein C0993_003484 [Termitomyces sp. T159_Od127]|nr:hypothetical protein C0993_003484 [Termitomyces sp. T159_Od127]